jgi:hypothetical protein
MKRKHGRITPRPRNGRARRFCTKIADADCYASILVSESRIPDSIFDLNSDAANGSFI